VIVHISWVTRLLAGLSGQRYRRRLSGLFIDGIERTGPGDIYDDLPELGYGDSNLGTVFEGAVGVEQPPSV
jgi:hypothetical protein